MNPSPPQDVLSNPKTQFKTLKIIKLLSLLSIALRWKPNSAYWREGSAAVDGACAINTSGGLIAKGHPVGATGIAMLGTCARQLQGKAPAALQVKDPRVAATFNVGGPICASVCTVLKPVA